MPPSALLGNGFKVLFAPQTFFPSQPLIFFQSRHGLYRQPFPPLGPSALQYQPSPSGTHPLQKSVCPLSADRTWLIGPLHLRVPRPPQLKRFLNISLNHTIASIVKRCPLCPEIFRQNLAQGNYTAHRPKMSLDKGKGFI